MVGESGVVVIMAATLSCLHHFSCRPLLATTPVPRGPALTTLHKHLLALVLTVLVVVADVPLCCVCGVVDELQSTTRVLLSSKRLLCSQACPFSCTATKPCYAVRLLSKWRWREGRRDSMH